MKFKSLDLYRRVQEDVKSAMGLNYEMQLVTQDSGDEDFSVSDLYDTKEIVPAYVRNEEEEVPKQIPLINRGMKYIEEALKEKGEQKL